ADTADHANGVISHIEAQVAIGAAEVAYDRYVEQFGFEPPPTDATGKRMYWIYRGDEPDIAAYLNFNNPPNPVSGCNGVSRTGNNVMAAWTGCFDAPTEQVFGVGAHELFHGVEIGHNGANETGWLMEGTARAMEDMIFNVLDNWSDAMSASFSFNQQADSYLDTTNKDLTAFNNRYDAALWWKFFTEQYGTTAVEPEFGVDAMLALWEATETADDIAAINQALSNLNAGVDFHSAYRRFVLANWTKDLTVSSLPDASYYYIDELQDGNPKTYGPIGPTSGGILSLNNSAQWTDQNVSRYGADYYSAIPGTNCPVATVTFSKDNGDTAFYHVVAEDGAALLAHTESNAQNWSQSFVNNADLSRLVAVLGSLENSSTVDVAFSCADPVIDIQLPNNFAPAYVGSSSDPGKFLVQLLVTNGAINAPVVAGLSLDDFRVEVNGIDAPIVAGGFVQEQYWLQVQAPDQAADGTYHLEVLMEEPGTNNAIASDISANSVVYDPAHTDQALIVDRSGSMSESDKMQAARDAANFYIDVSREDDGLAVVPFNGDINPPAFDMQSVDDTVRDQAHSFVNSLVPNGSTSIGDGLNEAVGQRLSSTTGNPRCSFVLMSDGMENTAQYWADIEGDVVATGCPVTTLAFGPTSNETLLQTIATATGGLPFYNDVSPSSKQLQAMITPDEMALGLADTYEYIQARAAGRQRLVAAAGTTTFPFVEGVHPVLVDQSVSRMLFALDWNDTNMVMRLRLRRPDGVIIDPATTPYTFLDGANSAHLGWRIAAPQPGVWEMLVTYLAPTTAVSAPYRVIAGGQSNLTVELLLPDRLGTSYRTGNSVPIYALVASDAPISDGQVLATVTAPNGNQVQLSLYDDGAHDDGAAGDGLFGNWYTAVNQAYVATPPDEGVPEPAANDEGAYRVRVVVTGPTYQREALGAFAVLEGPDVNLNSLPDPYEDEHGVDDPDADPDLDGLTTLREYVAGTDPLDSDTDDGGENDGSEVNHSQNPL
ncbi:MAG: VWA domain-containing protein, partial [Planctomycetota bacterium]